VKPDLSQEKKPDGFYLWKAASKPPLFKGEVAREAVKKRKVKR